MKKSLFFVLLLTACICLPNLASAKHGPPCCDDPGTTTGSLVAYYPFDGDATDATGNGHDGDPKGDISYTDGHIGDAAYFNGNSYIRVNGGGDLSLTSWTITGWVKLEKDSSYAGIVFTEPNGWDKYNYGINYTAKKGFGLQYETCHSENDHTVDAKGGVEVGKWVHFASVRDESTGTVSLYINGQKANSKHWGNNNTPCTYNGKINIGAWINKGNRFEGWIDELRFYNYALTGAELLDLYTQTGDDDDDDDITTDMVAYYPFDGDAKDYSGKGNHGLGVSLTFVDGKQNQAAQFDGRSSRVEVPASDTLNLTSWTIAFWMRNNDIDDSSGIIAKNDNDNGKYNFGIFYDEDPAKRLSSQYETCTSEHDHLIRYTEDMGEGVWRYVVSVKDETTGLHALYIDGQEVASNFWDDTGCAESQPMYIGAWKEGSFPMDGEIDELRIYDHALTPQQILELYGGEGDGALVAHYPFDGDAQDYSGLGNHGTEQNGVAYITGRFGQAASFDGVDDLIDIPASSSLTLTSWTITAWLQVGDLAEEMAIWAKQPNDLDKYNYMLRFNPNRGFITMYENCDSEDDHEVEFLPAMSQDQWVFVASVRDAATGEHALYVDGQKVATQTYDDEVCATDEPFILGDKWKQDHFAAFNGAIDDLRIYNYAMGASGIQALYSADADGLVAYYPFEENTNDLSGAGNHGIGNGVDYITGKLGKAARFDGYQDYVFVPASPSLSLTSWTISGWARVTDLVDNGALIAKEPNADDIYNYAIYYHGKNGNGLASQYEACGAEGNHFIFWDGVEENVWFFFTSVMDATTGENSLYINGQLLSSTTWSDTPCVSLTDLYIGAWKNLANSYEGDLDEVRIYNRPLNPTEIMDLYNQVGDWEFKLTWDNNIYTTDPMTMGSILSFEYRFDIPTPPPYDPNYMDDVLAVQILQSWEFIGEVTSYTSSNGWIYVEMSIPEALWGLVKQLRFVLNDFAPETFPVVYLRNIKMTGPPASGQHRYELYNVGMTWTEAKTFCEGLGGYLATVTSRDEHDIINALIDGSSNIYWLGGTDADEEGVWKWITGEPWDFSLWHGGEPNNYHPGEPVLVINYFNDEDSEWNDYFNDPPQTVYPCCEFED